MFHRRRKGREFIHMYLYNYYIILIWGISCIFFITSGLCEIPHNQQQQHRKQPQQPQQSNRKDLIENAMKSNLLRLFNLKEVPKPPTNKAYVPVEMLREYMKYRDLVRHYIPDDRDYLGKINLDDLHPSDHNFWNEVYNKYSHGIEIDLTAYDESNDSYKKFHSMGHIDQISAIYPESEPEEIDPKLESILPPHYKMHHQFSSVHIKFNLSQDMYQKPYGPENVRGAELRLNREKLLDCHDEGDCDRYAQQTANRHFSNRTDKIHEQRPNVATEHHVPLFQRLFINSVEGYDNDGTPRTRVLHSQRLNTQYSTPISYDISDLVRRWLKNPETNYGIIIRITNDDPDYDKLTKRSNASNATTTKTTEPRDSVFEHVRLKRGFRYTSDSEDSWLRQKPFLTLYLASDDQTTHGVKQDDELDTEMNGAQADAPNPSVDSTNYDGTLASTSLSSSQSANGSNKPTTSIPSTVSYQRLSPSIKRDSRQTNSKVPTPQRSTSTRGPPSSTKRPRGNKTSKPQRNQKCNLVQFTINFDEVGWSNWIIAPSSYLANYCMGDCSFPLGDHQNSTNHAIIQAIFHSVGRNVPRTCCAPTKLGRMAILFQLDRSVQMKYYDDMIVESCGCL